MKTVRLSCSPFSASRNWGSFSFWAVLAGFCMLLAFSACEKGLLKEEFPNDPQGNFNAFWTEFDRYYGAFEAKRINWDSLKVVYGKKITATSTDADLFIVLAKLLVALNDGHASLYAPRFGSFYSHPISSFFADSATLDGREIIALQDLIRTKYLKDDYQSVTQANWKFFYGSIASGTHRIGYICLPTFLNEAYPDQFIIDAVNHFKSMDAVVIDIRYNAGGSTEAFVKAMNLFSSERTLYMKSRFRNGPHHSDFTPFNDHYTQPKTDNLKGKPIAVLINGLTASSSDHFLLGLKSQPHVISIGSTTWGAFSGVVNRILPNGWQFRLGAEVVYTPEGKLLTDWKGRYLEGIGIAPDYPVMDRLRSVNSGKDDPLDKAIQLLNLMIK